MIDLNVRIHDKFSVEFKTGFIVDRKPGADIFALNMWLFIPNSLDINAETYSKGQFYRDVKSNVRLITPVFHLKYIAGGDAIPLAKLQTSFRNFAADPSRANIAAYEYEIKMFMAILKSSIRDEITYITAIGDRFKAEEMCENMIADIKTITDAYRQSFEIINTSSIPQERLNYFWFGDEFMSNLIELRIFKLIEDFKSKHGRKGTSCKKKLAELILSEVDYKRFKGFPVVEPDNKEANRAVIFRHRILKKYIESDLFLSAKKKRDGLAMEQFYYSIAAGLSMIFATAIAFSFQQKYGNFTMPLFVALVVSYMLKDRIKEIMRYYFAHRLKEKYFDNKTTIAIKDQQIGWIKEGMDFITDEKVPSNVMELRSRSPLLQAENRINDEKIILFRKMVKIEGEMLYDEEQYSIDGINDITRLHLTNLIQKTDNPEVPLYFFDKNQNIVETEGQKVYYLNIIIQMQHGEQLKYKRIRLILNRRGIMELEELM